MLHRCFSATSNSQLFRYAQYLRTDPALLMEPARAMLEAR